MPIPGEVIRSTIRNNQKCFVLRDPQSAKLVDHFILVANEEASDGGKQIVAGNERVIRARLSDAKFFYETDLKTRLEDRLPKFEHIVFHEKLGTQAERIARIEVLAGDLADIVGADAAKAQRAARLCKADLLTEVVGEFPELQGLMGRYYAEAQGEDEAVAHAIEDHYKPKGPDDLVPGDPVAIAVALADKIDTLVGFWLIDEKPTGSKDPYALQARSARRHPHRDRERAAAALAHDAVAPFRRGGARREAARGHRAAASAARGHRQAERRRYRAGGQARSADRREEPAGDRSGAGAGPFLPAARPTTCSPSSPTASRCNCASRARATTWSTPCSRSATRTICLMVVRRVEALGKFLDTDDGKNLLAGYKRATNIIRIEEKKDKRDYTGAPDRQALRPGRGKGAGRRRSAPPRTRPRAAVAKEDFAAAMRAIATLRPVVDAFFDKVTVNVDDASCARIA